MIRSAKRLRLCYTLLCLLLVFIWGNSLMPAEISAGFSGWIKEILDKLLPGFSTGDGETGHHLLRKLAHFSEFAALGVTLSWLGGMKEWKRYLPLACGVSAACVDEFLQLFSPGRSASIVDVGFDSSGGLTGMILLWSGYAIYQRKKRR